MGWGEERERWMTAIFLAWVSECIYGGIANGKGLGENLLVCLHATSFQKELKLSCTNTEHAVIKISRCRERSKEQSKAGKTVGSQEPG